MRRTLVRTVAAAAVVVTGTLATTSPVVGAAAGAPTPGVTTATTASPSPGAAVPTFKAFVAATFRDTDGGYIVNGDEPVATTEQLRAFYDKVVAQPDPLIDGLIVNTVNGADDTWSAGQALNLTYCVSAKFATDYPRVRKAMADGAAQWEAASSNVNFIHVSAQDRLCTTRNTNVVFSISPTTTTRYIARSFFPSSSKPSRNILVNVPGLFSSGPWTPSNIMGHELGHVLGLRHEHTRPESGTCFENDSWRPLTPYDSASIMHYPQCNGTGTDLSMSAQDRIGIRALYGGTGN